MTLPQETIEQEFKRRFTKERYDNGQIIEIDHFVGRCATEWAVKASGLADALEKLNTAIDKTWNECNTKSIPDKHKKEISAAQAQCGAALAKYKEVGNG